MSRPLMTVCVLACAVSVLVSAAPLESDKYQASSLRACLWQCGQCFMKSDDLLMICANDLCMGAARSDPETILLQNVMAKTCLHLPKALQALKRPSGLLNGGQTALGF